jgi:hypothetical protein
VTDEEALEDFLNQPAGVDVSAQSPSTLSEERSLEATSILDDIGVISGREQLRTTSNGMIFVEDLQEALAESRRSGRKFRCSTEQLKWLRKIRESLE